MRAVELRTSRLILRPWRKADLAAFAALNADAEVRRWYAASLSRRESDDEAERLQSHIADYGFGFWAVEAPDVAPFLGFVGVKTVTIATGFVPAFEAGWRIARRYWGCGYATEAAQASIRHGFDEIGLSEIVAYTVPENSASRRVMERVGMRRDPKGDFEHPALPEGHPLGLQVLYRAHREVYGKEGT